MRRRSGVAYSRATVLLAVALHLLLTTSPASALPPEASVSSLEQDLRHGQYAVRARAARILGYLGDGRHVSALANMALHDRARESRRAAAYALAKLGNSDAAPALMARLLGELSPGFARPDTKAGAKQREAIIPLIYALGTLDAASAVDLLCRCVKAPDPLVQHEALLALARLSTPQAVPPLLAAAREASVDDRLLAARLIGWRADSDAAPGIIAALGQTGEHPSVGEALVGALARVGGDGATGALIQALRHPLPQVRREAAEMLGRQGATAAIDALESATTDPLAQVSAHALVALAQLAPERAAKLVPVALASSSPDLRRAAVWALRFSSEATAAQMLARISLSADAECATLAVEGLAERPDTTGAIGRTALQAQGPARYAAVQALAWRGDVGSDDVLEDCILAADGDLQPAGTPLPLWRLAAEGLALTGRSPAVPRLLEALNGDARALQIRAIESLGVIGGEQAADALCRMDVSALSVDCRAARMKALALQDGQPATGALLLALSDTSDAVRELAASGLVMRRDCLPGLVEVACEGRPGSPAWEAADRALAVALEIRSITGGAEQDRQALLRWARRPGAAIPHALVLRACTGESVEAGKAIGSLRALLLSGDTDADVRDRACLAMGRAPWRLEVFRPLAREYLATLCGGPKWASGARRVRFIRTAIQTVRMLGDADAAPVLYDCLAETAQVRAEALAALSLDAEGGVTLLARGLRDEDEGVRRAALAAIAGSGLSVDLRPMMVDLAATDEAGRLGVALSLREHASTDAQALLRQLAMDQDVPVAIVVAVASASRLARDGETSRAQSLLTGAMKWRAYCGLGDPLLREALAASYGILSRDCAGPDPDAAPRLARRAYLLSPEPETLMSVARAMRSAGDGVKRTARAEARATQACYLQALSDWQSP